MLLSVLFIVSVDSYCRLLLNENKTSGSTRSIHKANGVTVSCDISGSHDKPPELTPATGDGNVLTQKGRSDPQSRSISVAAGDRETTGELFIPSTGRALSCRPAFLFLRVKRRSLTVTCHTDRYVLRRRHGFLCPPRQRGPTCVRKRSAPSALPRDEKEKSARDGEVIFLWEVVVMARRGARVLGPASLSLSYGYTHAT